MRANVKRSPSKVRGILSRSKAMAKGKKEVVVGLPSGSANYPDGTSVIAVATSHEFGINNPERSFLRSTVAENRRKYIKLIKRGGAGVLLGRNSMESILKKMGQMVESDVKMKIVTLKSPPNTEEVIARKKSSNPLIDTAHMLGQIKYEVV